MAKRKSKVSKKAKALGKKKVSLKTIFFIVLLLVAVGGFILPGLSSKPGEQVVITTSTLEKAVKSSSLSTYQTVYRGVAESWSSDKKPKLNYYVSYDATVKAGFDFKNIKIEKDDDNKKVMVYLPKIQLDEPVVQIESLNYIIKNKKLKQSSISAEAYKLCIKDAKDEASEQKAILDYAKENAENLIRGLLKPFIDQLGYELEFNMEAK